MVEASSGLVCVLVDCDWGKKNVELSEKYGVRGYPTVLFCDPDGKVIERLGARDPASVAAQMRRIVAGAGAEKPPPPGFVPFSPQILAFARANGKPLIVYFYDDSPASETMHQTLVDPHLRPISPRFLVAKHPYAKADPVCARFKVDRAPLLLVLDPAAERPEEAPLARIPGSRSPRELYRDLDPIRPGRADVPERPADAAPRPLVTKEDEAMSDDELDRKFIRAQIRVAEEHLNRNRKDKAKEVLEDIVKNYPKHRATLEARKLLEKLN